MDSPLTTHQGVAGALLLVSLVANCSGSHAAHHFSVDAAVTPKAGTAAGVTLGFNAAEAPTDGGHLDATVVSGPMPELTRDDICTLARLVGHRRFQGKVGASLLEQPCATDTAGVSSKMATDVTLWSSRQPTQPAVRPLVRGDTCGDDQLLVWCDAGKTDRCTNDRRLNRHGKLWIQLNRLDPTEVDSEAEIFIPTPQPRDKRYRRYAISPCLELRARFSKATGTWVEKRLSGSGYWP